MQAILNSTKPLPVLERYSDEVINQKFSPSVHVIDRASYPLFAIIGIPGSLISAIIWSRKPMRRGNSAAAIYQASSGVVDLCYLLLFVIWYLHSPWNMGALNFPALCETFIIANYWFQYLFPGILLVFTLERYLAICHPFRSQNCLIRASERGAIKILSIILLICLFTALPYSYFFTYINGSCTSREEVGEISNRYIQVTEVFYFFCLPLTTLLLNVMVIQVLHRSVDIHKNPQLKTLVPVTTIKNNGTHGGSDPHPPTANNCASYEHISRTVRASTVTILCTSFYVLLVYLGYSITILILPTFRGGDPYLSDEEVAKDPDWQAFFGVYIAKSIMSALQSSQCTAKFPIYLASSRQFRKEFCRLFSRCAPRCSTRDMLKSFAAGNLEDSVCQSSLIRPTPGRGQQSGSCNSTVESPSPRYGNNARLHGPLRRVWSGGAAVGRRSRPSLGLTRSVIMANGERTFLNATPV